MQKISQNTEVPRAMHSPTLAKFKKWKERPESEQKANRTSSWAACPFLICLVIFSCSCILSNKNSKAISVKKKSYKDSNCFPRKPWGTVLGLSLKYSDSGKHGQATAWSRTGHSHLFQSQFTSKAGLINLLHLPTCFPICSLSYLLTTL